MAVMTRRWARLKWASLVARQSAPWRRKTSATSRIGRGIAGVSGRRCHLHVQKFERALDLPDGVDGHTCIAGGGRNVTMTEQILNYVNVDALFQEMSGEAVAQRVHGDCFIEPCGLSCLAASSFHRACGDRPNPVRAREKPMLGAGLLPVETQGGEEILGQHDVANLSPPGFSHNNEHSLSGDVPRRLHSIRRGNES